MNLQEIVLLVLAASAAGWIDAVVGGGGLVQIPALMVAFPTLPVAAALGTNKLAGVAGTFTAATTYARSTDINKRIVLPAALLSIGCAGVGAECASSVPSQYFRPAVIVILLLVASFVTLRPNFGKLCDGTDMVSRYKVGAIIISGCIGFYDGILGPGTGTFLIITFTALLGLNFIHGSAAAKVVNCGTNLGALAIFAAQGNVLWMVGVGMALCNIVSAHLGAKMALKYGSRFVRVVLMVVVTALSVKLGIDQFADIAGSTAWQSNQ